MTLHVCTFSTGIASAITAERVMQKGLHVKLLFTDVQFEDEDNHRFLEDCLEYFDRMLYDYELITVKEGRNPLQLFTDEGVLGCDRIPVCSRKLKTEQTEKWLKSQEGDVVIYFGFDFAEFHRARRVEKRYKESYKNVTCGFPLCEPPFSPPDKCAYIRDVWGVEPPRMYKLGFKHANCGGRCVRGKKQHWRQLLRIWPERFKQMEDYEKQFKGGKYSFLKGYPLEKLRKDYENQLDLFAEEDSAQNAPCIRCTYE